MATINMGATPLHIIKQNTPTTFVCLIKRDKIKNYGMDFHNVFPVDGVIHEGGLGV